MLHQSTSCISLNFSSMLPIIVQTHAYIINYLSKTLQSLQTKAYKWQ